MKKTSLIITILFLLLSFAGCAGNPDKVFQKYVDAAHAEKTDEAVSYCSKEIQDKYNNASNEEKKALGTMLKFSAPQYPKLLKKEIKGDSAELYYEGKVYIKKKERETGKMQVEFVKQDGKWKIKRMKVER